MKNSTNHMFIVIEGIDGSGKTTVSHELCKRFDAQYYKTPPRFLEKFSSQFDSKEISLRRFVDDFAHTDPQMRFLFYLFGLANASREIGHLLKNGHVICDRYLSSTLAYHWALDSNLAAVDVSWLSLIEPDFEFLLTINDSTEHQRRLFERGFDLRTDVALEKDFEFLKQVQNNFQRLNLHEIDVSHLTVAEVVTSLERQVEHDYRSSNAIRTHKSNYVIPFEHA